MVRKSVWAGAVLAILAGSSVEAVAQGTPTNPVAGAASVTCERPSWSSRSRCTPEQFLLGRLNRDGLSTAMAVLDSLSQVDPEVRRLGHNFAHAMGLAAFTPTVDVGSIFNQCTPLFQAGCHHGVIQAYFAYHGRMHGDHVDAAVVNGLCETVRVDTSQRRLLFECTHGLGHGLMMVGNYNLPAVLETCDLLTDPWEQQVCYGASLMENIVHATAPHHAPGAASMAMVEAGASDAAHVHTPAETTTAAPPQFIPLKKDEPFYPCTVLRDRYVLACYQMQTSAILNLNHFDVPGAARICATAPELFRSTCYQSLGRDISALTVQDNTKAMRLCVSVPAEYRAYCHLGYAKNLVDQTSRIQDGLDFCVTLETPDSKRACYSGMGEQAWSLYPAVDRREQICGAVEAAYMNACRLGAGLQQGALRGLPTNRATAGLYCCVLGALASVSAVAVPSRHSGEGRNPEGSRSKPNFWVTLHGSAAHRTAPAFAGMTTGYLLGRLDLHDFSSAVAIAGVQQRSSGRLKPVGFNGDLAFDRVTTFAAE